MKFATSPKMSSYLVAMAVGDFKCLEGAAEGMPIRICATPDKTRSRAHRARVGAADPARSTTATTPSSTRSGSSTSSPFPISPRARWRTPRRSSTARPICSPTRKSASVDTQQEDRVDPRARDGAPVVRRSRHDAVVGRPLAERRLRDLDGEQAAGRGASGMEHRRSTKRADNQTALGLDSLQVDARRFTPTCRRRRRSTRRSTRSPTRRAPRCCA